MESSRRGLVLLVVVLGVSALLGGVYGPTVRATASAGSDLEESVKSFTRVLAIVQRNYADPVDPDKAVYDGAIPGMLHMLDPHSNFFDPHAYSTFLEEEQGRYYGVGMLVSQRSNQTVVIAPYPDSPAARAGIRPGDVIAKVDGKSCDGLTSTEVASLLKGPKGTQVHIALTREGWDKPIEVDVTRDEIPHPGVDFYALVKPGIAYIRVSGFNETTDSELAEALHRLDVAHLDGVILDLRNNPGGLLNQAVGISDMFLPKDELVVSQHGRAMPERRFYATRGNNGVDVPLVVLVNGQSASASEIVAGSIQDHDRGIVAGDTSFGKGLVQSQFPLSENTALLLTTGRYYTPSGRLIQRDYKNVSLYDYYYNRHPAVQHEVKLTDTGRQVLGGSGITPDVKLDAPKPNPFQTLLMRRAVFFPSGPLQQGVGDFTRWYLGQKPDVTRDFTANDAVLVQFRRYLEKESIRYTEPDIQANLQWIQFKIRREVFTSVFGLNEGYRIEMQQDEQVQKAIELIPQARALFDNAKKVLAQRMAGENLKQQ
jgi:carboxyl-terminal processing protease